MVICSLAILKAGGAYLPLDASYPPERLNLMINDSGAKLLITTPELNDNINSDFSGYRMMTGDISKLVDCETKLPVPEKHDLFIMLYTSGSTGLPKGVMLEHGNLTAFCSWARRYYSFDETSRAAAYASFGFDANMLDTYPTLTSGGTLYIIDENMRLDIMGLQNYFNENGITHSFITTQVGRQFALLEGTDTLRYLSIGGEKLVPIDPPSYNFYNVYGPTETTVLVTGAKIDRRYKDVPIGKAIDNIKLYVTDKNGKLLPPGAAGELWIAGYQVSRSYLNRPEQTAKAYTKNPFCDKDGFDRVYHTGDVVRHTPDGSLQFIGRRDSQVKVRGFRIELTEVEEIIRKFEGIKDATVAAYDDPAGGKFIAAYIVSDEKISIDALNRFIMDEKPPYMVPAVTMQIDAIPMNQNQKVNKRALPKPDFTPVGRKKTDSRPLTILEERIASVAESSVGVKITDTGTPLINMGVTSISAISFVTRLDKELGVNIPVKKILGGYNLIDIENEIVNQLLTRTAVEEKSDEAQDRYPITQTQFGIYSECIMYPENTIAPPIN